MGLRFARQVAVLVATAALPIAAMAESNLSSGAGTLTASARVNFSIVIPRLLFLQVGTGPTAPAIGNVGTIDTISFTPAVGVIGDGTVVNATAGSGNLGNGSVTVRILSNVGNVSLGAVGTTALTNGSQTIPWTEIATAVTGGATHPTIDGSTVSFTAVSGVVNVAGTWTYTYLNSLVPAAGTYNGQVTYTATSP